MSLLLFYCDHCDRLDTGPPPVDSGIRRHEFGCTGEFDLVGDADLPRLILLRLDDIARSTRSLRSGLSSLSDDVYRAAGRRRGEP